uniref:Gypsy retrotransposon integrase-like protein 1 n=1 Tax=Kryptolebias marmoratus TaxID=37003 RepID=A0A3Q3APQ7_KRYMA
MLILPAELSIQGNKTSTQVFIDSGADSEFIDEAFAKSLGIEIIPSHNDHKITALDGHVLAQDNSETRPIQLSICGNHHETLKFFVIHSPDLPVILGATWLTNHNPRIDWVKREITGWAEKCSASCLLDAVLDSSQSDDKPENYPDISKVPPEYLDLKEVFSKVKATSLPPHRPYDCPIDLLAGSVPPRGRLFSLSRPEQEAMAKYIKESLQACIIRPSVSPAGARFFFVGKKDGSLRPCIDYRGLNNITIKNKYPLPLMSSAFDLIQGAKFFIKLDLRNVYHLIRIREGDEWKTAFNTPSGHYEYLVMPFGLTNAPAVFQSLVNDLLCDMINQFVFVYLDDILIFSRDLVSHRDHVRRVLLRLLQNKLHVKAEKCEFHQTTTSFLGFNISPNQVSMDQAKVTAINDWPVSKDRKSLQRFLGFANFYRKFIKSFSQVAAPLHALTSVKNQFTWNQDAQTAFDQLRDLFTKAPILHSLDEDRQFIVEVDASSSGVGAVLSQVFDDNQLHPCAFFSKRLTCAERNYDVGEREFLAVKLALEEWRHWLERAKEPFVIWTDHKNLEYLKTAKRLSSRQARWALFFSRFTSPTGLAKRTQRRMLSHGSMKENWWIRNPDQRSSSCQTVRLSITKLEEDLRQALQEHPSPSACPSDRMFVPPELRTKVLTFCHNSKIFCHPGITKTLSVVKSQFWWDSLNRDVQEFVSACPQCARAKVSRRRPVGLLSHIAMDFITGLPASSGNSVILTNIDRFSKMVHLVPLKKLPTSKELADIMAREVFRLHGIPKDIVSDRGPQFISKFWREFCNLLDISTSLSSGFHPQTDGQTERANQEIETKLRLLCSSEPARWSDNLPWVEHAM